MPAHIQNGSFIVNNKNGAFSFDNLLGALGMFTAVVVTLLDRQILSFEIILAGVVVGAGVGAVLALKIRMTAMPQLVALFNGFGGGASVLVAGAALIEVTSLSGIPSGQFTVATAALSRIGYPLDKNTRKSTTLPLRPTRTSRTTLP